MPIVFAEGVGRDPSSPSQPSRHRTGWVTCDATSQGGPKFFEPCSPESSPPLPQIPVQAPVPEPVAEAELRGPPAHAGGQPSAGYGAGSAAEANHGGGCPSGDRAAGAAGSSWDKNRIWRVVSLD